ncbi:MAG: hypothetical protein ABI539_06770 [Acidobacteriota bacterium]
MKHSDRPTNNRNLVIVTLVLTFVVMACDSPPWSRFVVANSTKSVITIRFYTPYPEMAHPYLYSVDEWKEKEHFTSGTPEDKFRINKEEGWIEADVSPGAAIEIDRARYPDVEQNIESNFLVDRLDIHGENIALSYSGRKEIYGLFQKEWIGAYSYVTGTSPLYAYYIKQ